MDNQAAAAESASMSSASSSSMETVSTSRVQQSAVIEDVSPPRRLADAFKEYYVEAGKLDEKLIAHAKALRMNDLLLEMHDRIMMTTHGDAESEKGLRDELIECNHDDILKKKGGGGHAHFQQAKIFLLAVLHCFPYAALARMVRSGGCDVNTKNDEGETALMIAYENSCFETTMQDLAELGCDFSLTNNKDENIMSVLTSIIISSRQKIANEKLCTFLHAHGVAADALETKQITQGFETFSSPQPRSTTSD
jgi:hypothetical protein